MSQGQATLPHSGFIEVLKNGPFRCLWFAQVLSQITVNMLTFVLAVVIYGQTKSNTAVSILYLTIGVPAAFFGILSGVYVDRFNKKNLLIITTVIRATLVGAILIFKDQLLIVYLLSILISLISQFFVPAEAALIPQYVDSPHLLPANSLFTLTFYSAIIGGFVIGGPLLSLLGEVGVLWLLIALFAGSTVFLAFLPAVKHVEIPKTDSLFAAFAQVQNDITVGLRFIRNSASVTLAIFTLTLAQAIIAIFASLGPGFADRILNIKLTDASIIILGPAALGMIGGALVIGSLIKFGKRKLIKSGIFLSGALLSFIAFLIFFRTNRWANASLEQLLSLNVAGAMVPLAVMAFFLLGFANSLIDVTCNTVLQERTTDEVRGRVYGVLASLIGGIAILPVILSGILADLFGIGKIFLLLGIVVLLIGTVMQVKGVGIEHKLFPK